MEMLIALVVSVSIVLLIVITISTFDLFGDRRKKAHERKMAKLGYEFIPKIEVEGRWVKNDHSDN